MNSSSKSSSERDTHAQTSETLRTTAADHDLMSEVRLLLAQLAHVADPEIAHLRKTCASALATAQHEARTRAHQLRKGSQAAIDASDTYVRNEPWRAVAVAAGVGALVGYLVSRR